MRSELALGMLLFVGCATPAQIDQCYPVASFQTPVYRCGVAAAPIVEVEPAPAEPAPPRVEVREETIDLREKVNFETASANLLPQSKALLDDVAKTLAEHPELTLIRIEGHTDGEGTQPYNQKLSDDRAASVRRHLISKGIDGKRLETRGFGEDKPVADNATEDGREQNRRVELRIIQRK
jgi:OOP family OmpA-OmpF porin